MKFWNNQPFPWHIEVYFTVTCDFTVSQWLGSQYGDKLKLRTVAEFSTVKFDSIEINTVIENWMNKLRNGKVTIGPESLDTSFPIVLFYVTEYSLRNNWLF